MICGTCLVLAPAGTFFPVKVDQGNNTPSDSVEKPDLQHLSCLTFIDQTNLQSLSFSCHICQCGNTAYERI